MTPKEFTISPERIIEALKNQLEALHTLDGRNFREADVDETEWEHSTRSLIDAAFGNPSSILSDFNHAKAAGSHNMLGISDRQRQRNFEERIKEQRAFLRGLIKTLKLQLPEEEIKGVYEPGEEYDFYRDLSSIIKTTAQEMFIVDAYLDENVFNLYVSKVPDAASVRVLSNQIGTNVQTIAKMYKSRRSLAIRSSPQVHDRVIFVDQRGWVIGRSIKDAARKKPTYLVELSEPNLTASRDAHNKIWDSASVVI